MAPKGGWGYDLPYFGWGGLPSMLSVDPPLFWRCLIKYCIILTKRFISLYILINCSSLRDINILNSTHDTLFYNFST